MRDQKRILYDTIIGAHAEGALKIDAPFLTFADVMECIREIARLLDGNAENLAANTLQTWLKSRVTIQEDRATRNRLFSGLDLIHISSVAYLAHVAGVPITLATEMAAAAMDELIAHPESYGKAGDAMAFAPGNYVIATPARDREGYWDVLSPTNADEFRLRIMRAGAMYVFHFALLVGFAFPILGEKWRAKANWLKGVIEREIAKKKGNR